MGEGRTTRGTQLISHSRAVLKNKKSDFGKILFSVTDESTYLRISDGGAEALLSSGILQVFQSLLGRLKLSLHGLDLILFLFLALVPLHAIGNAVRSRVLDRCAELVDVLLQVGDRDFCAFDLRLPLFGRALGLDRSGFSAGIIVVGRQRIGGARTGRVDVLGNLVVGDDSFRWLGRRTIFCRGIAYRVGSWFCSVSSLHALVGCVLALSIFFRSGRRVSISLL